MDIIKIMLVGKESQKHIKEHLECSQLNFVFSHVKERYDFIRNINIIPPDVIITDCWPDEYEFSKYSDLLGDDFSTPVIVINGRNRIDEMDSKSGAYVLDYLPKGELHNLPQAIQRILENHKVNKKTLPKILNEDRYRLLAENSSDMIATHSLDGVYTYVTPSCEDMLGYKPEELIGLSGYDFINPDDIPAVEEQHMKLLKSEGKARVDYRMRKKSGEYLWTESTAKPILHETTGEMLGLVVVTRDITERLQKEKKLKQIEQRLNEAQHLAHFGNWNFDAETNEVYWSTGIRKIYGISKDFPISYEFFLSSIHPDDKTRVFNKISEGHASGKPVDQVFRIIRPDGEVRHVHEIMKAEHDANGAVVRVFGTSHDITEQKLNEDKLLRTEALMLEAQQMAHFGYWNFDVKSNELFCSNGLRRIYGMAEDEDVSFETFLSAAHPKDKVRFIGAVKKLEKAGTTVDHIFRIVRKDGEVRYVHDIVKSNVDKNGVLLRIYGTSQDVTELKRTQARLESILDDLEVRVAQRTKELSETNDKLITEIKEKTRLGEELENKNKGITESIQYAERLQNAVLPDIERFKRIYKDSFIINKPKDIVSGDFYWMHKTRQKTLIACADCTGHGVPGAFMSLLGADALKRIVTDQEWKYPSLVLELLDVELEQILNKGQQVNDGMDMVFCMIDALEKKIYFAGAMNPIIVGRKDGIEVYKGSRFSLGGYLKSSKKKFETIEIPYDDGDMLYMFSDGYQDQFGGNKGKKMMFKGLKTMIEEIHLLSASEQKSVLLNHFEDWKKDTEQVDDVLVMGLRL